MLSEAKHPSGSSLRPYVGVLKGSPVSRRGARPCALTKTVGMSQEWQMVLYLYDAGFEARYGLSSNQDLCVSSWLLGFQHGYVSMLVLHIGT